MFAQHKPKDAACMWGNKSCETEALTAWSVFLARVSFSSQSRAMFWILLALWSSSSSLNTQRNMMHKHSWWCHSENTKLLNVCRFLPVDNNLEQKNMCANKCSECFQGWLKKNMRGENALGKCSWENKNLMRTYKLIPNTSKKQHRIIK